MIRLRAATLSRGGRTLLSNIDLSLSPGERIALVGANGSGKTTLLAALAGELSPDTGEIDQPWTNVIRLEQSLPTGTLPAWRHVVDGDLALVEARTRLEQAQSASNDADAAKGIELAQALDHWTEIEGHSAEARCRALLDGLGFGEDQAVQPVDALSGGWRMRLNLARALFCRSDLLLLDEPTNHLDLDAVLWLERWLLRYPGTMIVVSHDRDFLDRVATATLHIDEGRIVRYAGGYSEFERLRAAHAQQAERRRAGDETRIAHLTRFIERFRAKASKARQAQSRMKALEKIVQVAPLRALRGVEISLHEVGDCPDPLLVADGLEAGYPGRSLLRKVNLSVRRGSRIGVLGRNGAGKSTLIRTLVGEIAPLAGAVTPSRAIRVGYFDQQAVDRLRADESALWHLQRSEPQAREQVLRDRLGRFGFSGEDATRPIGPMSGGEKARLALALMLQGEPQLLVLDEPTNHLDGATRDALAEALADFDGALVLVSHDRYLLRVATDTLIVVRDGGAEAFDGDLDDYASWLLRSRTDREPLASERTNQSADRPGDRREERRIMARHRERLASLLAPIERQLGRIETSLEAIAHEIERLDGLIADPAVYADRAQAARIARERGVAGQRKEALEEEWLLASEQADRVRKEAGDPSAQWSDSARASAP